MNASRLKQNMINILKLDWKHFVIDFIQDPGMTIRRIFDVINQGTSLQKFERISRAIFAEDSDYSARYPEEMAYLKSLPQGTIDVVPYPMKGPPTTITVCDDVVDQLHYVEHRGRKLYFPKTMSKQDCENCYRSLMEGEDILGKGRVKSPHSYEDETHFVGEGDVVIDVGSAEGLFALNVAERAGRIYLFEMLQRWNRPLKLTFAPFAKKTVIVNKLVSGETQGDSIRLEDAVQDLNHDEVCFIKMDIEGWEKTVLMASESFLKSHRVKISCCVYHRQRDADEISEYLKRIGFKVRFSEGYMIPPLHRVEPPYFRKGMIYAQNF